MGCHKVVAKYTCDTMKSKYKISTYNNTACATYISMLRDIQHERYHTPTYVCSLAITMAMGPMAPL